jgi:N-acetylmuramoyl-L-alanine amidase
VNAGGGTGYEDYTFPGAEEADRICRVIRKDVIDYLSRYAFVDRGHKAARFGVLKCKQPAILTENLFIDHPADSVMLGDDDFLKGLAGAYVTGIAKVFDKKKEGEMQVVPEWAKDAVEWALDKGIINSKDGTNDFYRCIVMLYRDNQRRGTL